MSCQCVGYHAPPNMPGHPSFGWSNWSDRDVLFYPFILLSPPQWSVLSRSASNRTTFPQPMPSPSPDHAETELPPCNHAHSYERDRAAAELATADASRAGKMFEADRSAQVQKAQGWIVLGGVEEGRKRIELHDLVLARKEVCLCARAREQDRAPVCTLWCVRARIV